MVITAPNEYLKVTDSKGEETKLVMQRVWLTGSLLSVGAVLRIQHFFRVGGQRPAEAIYSFPLPRDAALRRFKIVGEGFSAESELRKTEEAVAAYEEGLEEGHLSGLVRQYRDGLVNLSLGNIRPGEEVAVFLEILAGVDLRDDGFRFRFPFTLAPSYHPRAIHVQSGAGTGTTELPEDEFGDVLLPDWKQHPDGLHEIGFDLSIRVAGTIREVGSPSHQISVEIGTVEDARVRLATASDVPNRDLVLDVRTAESGPSTVASRSETGDGRFVSVIPSGQFGNIASESRNIVFVVDRSGSMGGGPMEQAKRALRACLAALSDKDRFGVVAFDNQVESFQESLVAGTRENRDRVARFLKSIDARGGTELSAGLEAGASLLAERTGDLFLLTDGQVFGALDILSRAKSTSYRVHCLGIGSASQDRLLTLLARSTGGVSRFVTPRERVDIAAAELFASAKNPVAEQVAAALAKGSPGCINPPPSTTIYPGNPLVVWGSAGAESVTMTVSWAQAGQEKSLEVPVTFEEDKRHETLKLLQGSRLITDLDSQMVSPDSGRSSVDKKKRSRVDRQLEKLSREYGLASRAMSLVAVVKRQGDRSGQVPDTLVVPVGMPEDVAFDSYFAQPDTALGMASLVNYRIGHVPRTSAAPASRRLKSWFPLSRVPARESLLSSEASDLVHSEGSDEIAQLLDLVAALQVDGGLAGRDTEARVGRSVTLLFLLEEQRNTIGTTAFDPYIKRLLRFVSSSVSRLPNEKALLAKRVIEHRRSGGAINWDWTKALPALVAIYSKSEKARLASFDFWKGIREELES